MAVKSNMVNYSDILTTIKLAGANCRTWKLNALIDTTIKAMVIAQAVVPDQRKMCTIWHEKPNRADKNLPSTITHGSQ